MQKTASRILFDAAKFGLGKIALSEFSTALDIAQIMAQLYSGFIASNQPPELEMQFPITEFYDCPLIVYPQDYMPPFGRGPMSGALEWPLGQPIPPVLKCQNLQAFPAPGNDPPVVHRTFTWPIQPYLVLYGPIHPTLDRWSYDRLWMIETPGNTPVGTPLALYKPRAPYFIPYADPFPEPAYSPFCPVRRTR